mgnify:CR=1 FL=1
MGLYFFITFLTFFILLVVYFIPAVVAFWRKKQNKAAILALNLFLGWTFIGWVVALVWSLSKDLSDIQTTK